MIDSAAAAHQSVAAGKPPAEPVTPVATAREHVLAARGPAGRAPRTEESGSPSWQTARPGIRDLATRDDVEHLLRDFYSRALVDPLLGHVFVDIVNMDLEAHLPTITDFWQKVLYGTGAYDGQPMELHRRLHRRVPLTSAHFDRWLCLWRDAVHQRHAGPVAERAVAHAERMAGVFLRNLTEPGKTPLTLPIVARSGNTS